MVAAWFDSIDFQVYGAHGPGRSTPARSSKRLSASRNLARGALSWGSQAAQALGRATADYLQEESRDLPPAAAVERFLEEVDRLRADSDRLAARVARLESAHRGVDDSQDRG